MSASKSSIENGKTEYVSIFTVRDKYRIKKNDFLCYTGKDLKGRAERVIVSCINCSH